MSEKKRSKVTKLKSISTPLGKIKVPVEIAEEPISEQIEEILDDDDPKEKK